jgi:hypothetical protein
MGTGVTQIGGDGLPFGSVITDGIVNPAALQGGPQKTDSQGHVIAPGVMTLTDGFKTTYSVAIANLVPATTAGDLFVLSWVAKVVRLTRVQISGTATTATTLDVTLVRRSTADSAGTSTSPAIVAHDSASGAASSTIKAYTVAPTAGTLVGLICAAKLLLAVPAASGGSVPVTWEFGERPAQAPVLRAALQSLAVTISAIPTGGSLNVSMEFTEE